METQEVLSEQQESLFHREGDPALAQVAQEGGGVSILGVIQRPSGHGPGQLTNWLTPCDIVSLRF